MGALGGPNGTNDEIIRGYVIGYADFDGVNFILMRTCVFALLAISRMRACAHWLTAVSKIVLPLFSVQSDFLSLKILPKIQI